MECDDKLERNFATFLLTALRRHRIENDPEYGPTFAASIILKSFMRIKLNKYGA